MAPTRGIPADILALSVPMLFAGGAFSTMLYRVIKYVYASASTSVRLNA